MEHLNWFSRTGHDTDIPGVFIRPLSRYPYLIFYKIVDDEVHILRVRRGVRSHPGIQEEPLEFVPA